jgi:hypothetical protein
VRRSLVLTFYCRHLLPIDLNALMMAGKGQAQVAVDQMKVQIEQYRVEAHMNRIRVSAAAKE